MKLIKFDKAMWGLSIGGLGIIAMYYITSAQFAIELPFEVALIGVALMFVANGILFVHWMGDMVSFVMKKEYISAIIMLLFGIFMFSGFWLR